MSKFRLTLARRRGEQIASEHGFDRFPVDPFRIAENEDILVEAKEPQVEGVSGCIVFNDDGVGIIYATDIRSEGFRRFTVAHELGHYFLDGHPEEILKTSSVHFSRAGFTQGDSSIEVEADHFASGLLMPTKLVRESLYAGAIGLAGIRRLAEDAECSLTASAIRAAECAPYPMAVIVSRGENVAYGFLSESFKKLGRLRVLRKGDPLPETATRSFNLEPVNVRDRREICVESTAERWFAGPSVQLDEEIVGLGRYGFTLTVLTAENLTEDLDEELDEEQKLVESWIPKFAYGR